MLLNLIHTALIEPRYVSVAMDKLGALMTTQHEHLEWFYYKTRQQQHIQESTSSECPDRQETADREVRAEEEG